MEHQDNTNMRKLYKIKVLHGAPKDSHTSIECYLVAESEEQVAEYISEEYHSGHWFGYDGDDVEVRWDDTLENEIPFRDYVMQNKGDLDDEEGWEDAHYGVTKHGWEEVSIPVTDIDVLLRLKVAYKYNKKCAGE